MYPVADISNIQVGAESQLCVGRSVELGQLEGHGDGSVLNSLPGMGWEGRDAETTSICPRGCLQLMGTYTQAVGLSM